MFLIGNYMRNPKKIVPTLYNYYFSRKLGFYEEFSTLSFFLQSHTAKRVNLSVKTYFLLAILSESHPNIS